LPVRDKNFDDRRNVAVLDHDVPGPGEVASFREYQIREIGRSGLVELAKILSFPASTRAYVASNAV
jgi:hypothetical protein